MVKNLKKPEPVARQNPPLYTTNNIIHVSVKKLEQSTNIKISRAVNYHPKTGMRSLEKIKYLVLILSLFYFFL